MLSQRSVTVGVKGMPLNVMPEDAVPPVTVEGLM